MVYTQPNACINFFLPSQCCCGWQIWSNFEHTKFVGASGMHVRKQRHAKIMIQSNINRRNALPVPLFVGNVFFESPNLSSNRVRIGSMKFGLLHSFYIFRQWAPIRRSTTRAICTAQATRCSSASAANFICTTRNKRHWLKLLSTFARRRGPMSFTDAQSLWQSQAPSRLQRIVRHKRHHCLTSTM